MASWLRAWRADLLQRSLQSLFRNRGLPLCAPGCAPRKVAAFHHIRRSLGERMTQVSQQLPRGVWLISAGKAPPVSSVCTELSSEEVLTPFMVLGEERPVHHKSRNTELYHGEKLWAELTETLSAKPGCHSPQSRASQSTPKEAVPAPTPSRGYCGWQEAVRGINCKI